MEFRNTNPSHAFTQKADALARMITLDIEITPVGNSTKKFKTKGIWDTGATNSVITQEVADALGISATGITNVNTASETNKPTATYLVDIFLKADLRVQGIEVTLGKINSEHGLDCLIGMDIINLGDLLITSFEGKTWLSFRIPSRGHVDYVDQINRANQIAQDFFKSGKRIDSPCPCNSGKKFKNCHGKDWVKA
ncbi:MAG TPA: retroviral-like aspartic protease family protein [Puia sp.]|jgi:predicted aspartyl protease|nr:retroviral-like aspartic protease family protein [Puia sp.]